MACDDARKMCESCRASAMVIHWDVLETGKGEGEGEEGGGEGERREEIEWGIEWGRAQNRVNKGRTEGEKRAT